MKITENIVDGCLLTVGTVTGLANIEHILGIIILVIQLTWLLIKLIVKIVRAIKGNKPLENLNDDVGSVIGKISDFRDTLNNSEVDTENEHNNKQK